MNEEKEQDTEVVGGVKLVEVASSGDDNLVED